MRKTIKVLVGLMASLILAVGCALPVFAAENLPESFLIDDDQGIRVDTAGDYFLNLEHIQPTDVFTKKLTVRNLEQGRGYSLSLTVETNVEQKGDVDWLDNLHLEIQLDGQSVYQGRLRGDGAPTASFPGCNVDMTYQGLFLGKYPQGQSRTVEFIVRVDTKKLTAKDLEDPSESLVRWKFTATQDVNAQPPNTGGQLARYALYVFPFLLLLLAVCIWWRTKKLKQDMLR
ncbi:MAG: hypothetical protein LBG83_04845 [Oscillospiraceae bacterium]|jgi:hypothetical protein|nr:hypothetical protein [Oscillospiraceae bacterium]